MTAFDNSRRRRRGGSPFGNDSEPEPAEGTEVANPETENTLNEIEEALAATQPNRGCGCFG